MNLKKIAILTLVLLALGVAVYFVNRGEKSRQEQEGKLLDRQVAQITRVDLLRGNERFLFVRAGNDWNLEAPLKAKADKIAVENILDNFASLRYDKLVEKEAKDFAVYGLDKPAIELKLYEKDPAKPSAAIRLGIKNEMDSSSYVRLASLNQVAVIASYKRDYLEKTLFDFRDKRFAGFDAVDVAALTFDYDTKGLAFTKKDDQWFMEKPIFSLARDTKISDIVSAAAQLEAKTFKAQVSAAALKEMGLDQPLLTVTFKLKDRTKTLTVSRKDEALYARMEGYPEICEINKDFLDKFATEAKEFRELKVARFDAFDVNEIAFTGKDFRAAFRKDKDGNWQPAVASLKGKAANDKVSDLISAVEGLEAGDFIDQPPAGQTFPYVVTLKVQPFGENQKTRTVDVRLSDASGDAVVAKNKDLPYLFKVSKDILDKLPKKAADLMETPTLPAPTQK